MVIKYNYSKGEFIERQDYDVDIVDIGTEAMRATHHWVTDIAKMLSEILPEGDLDLEVVGDMTFGELKDKLHTIFLKGTPWTDEEVALYKIDEKIRESTIMTNRVIRDEPKYVSLEYFEHFDCKLFYEDKTFQAKDVFRVGCNTEDENDIYIMWVIPEEEIEGLTPEKKKKSIFKRGE